MRKANLIQRRKAILLAGLAFMPSAMYAQQTTNEVGTQAITQPTARSTPTDQKTGEQASTQTKLDAVPRDNSKTAPGDIVVTAQRREQRLQDVPIQVTALGSQTIETAGIKSTSDALQLVPNVTFDQSFTYLNSFITVRGISQINNADPPVAMVVDGVPLNNQKQFRMDLFDIERIEVLKGPQGGLYGRNALGGAINIVTKQPTNKYEGFADITYGNGNALQTDAALSGPIVKDELLFRVSGSFKRDDGRITNAYLNDKVDFIRHDVNVRGQLLYVGSDRLKMDLRGDYRNFNAGGIYDGYVYSGNANDIEPPVTNMLGNTFGHIADASFKFDYDLGGVTLTGITGYSNLHENYRGDLDFSNPRDLPGGFPGLGFQLGQGQNLYVQQISQELRLVSDPGRPFRWIVGAYYLHTDRELLTRVFKDTNGSNSQFDDLTKTLVAPHEKDKFNAYAGYAQFDWDLTSNLILSGALRYDADHREQTNVLNGAVRSKLFDHVQPKVTLTWKPAPGKLLYATYGTGFRSGGFNSANVYIPLFNAETLQNYEGGFKTTWIDGKLLFNGAVYFERDHNYQFFFLDNTSASQIITNLARVNIWGVEFDAQARLSSQLTVGASIGTTDSNIRATTIFPTSVGNHTPKTTPYTASGNAEYRAHLSDTTDFIFRGDVTHYGKRYWQVDNVNVQRKITLVNLRAGIDTGRFSIYGFGKNVFNIRYYSDYNPAKFSGLPYDAGFLAQPATYGVEAKVRF